MMQPAPQPPPGFFEQVGTSFTEQAAKWVAGALLLVLLGALGILFAKRRLRRDHAVLAIIGLASADDNMVLLFGSHVQAGRVELTHPSDAAVAEKYLAAFRRAVKLGFIRPYSPASVQAFTLTESGLKLAKSVAAKYRSAPQDVAA